MNKSKNTEWKPVSLKTDSLNFVGVQSGALEHDGDSFIALTLKLADGKTVRIRKADYGVRVEEPIIPVTVKYIATTPRGLKAEFLTKLEAEEALNGSEGEVVEITIPKERQTDEIPF